MVEGLGKRLVSRLLGKPTGEELSQTITVSPDDQHHPTVTTPKLSEQDIKAQKATEKYAEAQYRYDQAKDKLDYYINKRRDCLFDLDPKHEPKVEEALKAELEEYNTTIPELCEKVEDRKKDLDEAKNEMDAIMKEG